jgi:mycothiol system anti-sigma-R factor
MSCGKHHDTDCSEVLERVFFFIDNELPTADSSLIQQHLEECGPCLQKYDLERTVKTLVQRSCHEHAPEALRNKVLLRIREVQGEMTQLHLD